MKPYVIEVLDFVVGIRIEGARQHTPIGEEYDKGNLRVYEVWLREQIKR